MMHDISVTMFCLCLFWTWMWYILNLSFISHLIDLTEYIRINYLWIRECSQLWIAKSIHGYIVQLSYFVDNCVPSEMFKNNSHSLWHILKQEWLIYLLRIVGIIKLLMNLLTIKLIIMCSTFFKRRQYINLLRTHINMFVILQETSIY